MFYLKEFFKSIGDSVFRGFSFFFFSCLLAFALTHRPWVQNIVEQVTPEKMVSPYFSVVIDQSVDKDAFLAKVKRLPGVQLVDDRVNEAAQEKLNKLVAELGADYQMSAPTEMMTALKIVMTGSISMESMQFIKAQVERSVGKEHLTSGEIKFPEITKSMSGHPVYSFLKSSGAWGVIGLLTLGWIISFWLCYDTFRTRSYLIERYQRKKFVAAKSIASGLGVVLLGFMGLGILNGTLKVFDIIILLMVFSVFWTFSMQDWKWRNN
ncbi:MAG: hypothetical protein ACOVP4_00935 [Bacteriovoracaceae bacterium]